MRAFLLAAGKGTRLQPLTLTQPKCLVKVGRKTILEFWINKLIKAGFSRVLINTSYLSEQVNSFISDSEYNNKVDLVHETELLGTTGSISKNRPYFGEEAGLVMHADNFGNVDFIRLKQAFIQRPRGCEIIAVTHTTKTPESCGIFHLDEEGWVTEIHEKKKSKHGNIANSAIFIISAQALEEIEKLHSDDLDFCGQTLLKFIGRIRTFHHQNFFVDIGTPASLEEARNFAKASGI